MGTFYLNHEAELYHYGVKGMKWGNHRTRNDYLVNHDRYQRSGYDTGRRMMENYENAKALERKKKAAEDRDEKERMTRRDEYVREQQAKRARYEAEMRAKEGERAAETKAIKSKEVSDSAAKDRALRVKNQRYAEVAARNKALKEQERQRARRKKRMEAESIARNAQYYMGKR